MAAFRFIEQIKTIKKGLALLIDPDRYDKASLLKLLEVANRCDGSDFIFVGGSLLFNNISETIALIKANSNKPVIIFPGNQMHVAKEADGILFLSLISGRNPEFLIGNHVTAAPKLKHLDIDIVPTGYILIDGGSSTSVSYMSNTTPIPFDKTDIAVATAMAGEMLGLQCIYLEAGSGAKHAVSAQTISRIKGTLNIPLIVGGGIKSPEQLKNAFDAGANLVVVGNALEQNPELLQEFSEIKQNF